MKDAICIKSLKIQNKRICINKGERLKFCSIIEELKFDKTTQNYCFVYNYPINGYGHFLFLNCFELMSGNDKNFIIQNFLIIEKKQDINSLRKITKIYQK